MEGKYRFCTTSHDDGEKLDGARFQPCTGARVGSETAKIPIIKDALKANESLISAMRRVNGSEKRLDQFTEQDVEKSLRKIVGNKVSTTAFSEAVSSDVIKSITR